MNDMSTVVWFWGSTAIGEHYLCISCRMWMQWSHSLRNRPQDVCKVMPQLLSMYADLLSPQSCHMHKIIFWNHSSKVLCSYPFLLIHSFCHLGELPSAQTAAGAKGLKSYGRKNLKLIKSYLSFFPSPINWKMAVIMSFQEKKWWHCGVHLDESLTLSRLGWLCLASACDSRMCSRAPYPP